MAVLLLAEVNGAEISMDQTAKALSAVQSLGDVTVLVAGEGAGPVELLFGVDRQQYALAEIGRKGSMPPRA